MVMPRKTTKISGKERTSKRNQMRRKKAEQIIEEFEKEAKEIAKLDLRKRAELAKKTLEDVFQHNPRQYLDVSKSILGKEIKKDIAVRKKQDRAEKDLPFKSEFKNIEDAMAEKDKLREKIRGTHNQKLIKEVKKRDEKILRNMEKMADKFDLARAWEHRQVKGRLQKYKKTKHYV
jgi:hypothetical protein